jgi:hypothetical protein
LFFHFFSSPSATFLSHREWTTFIVLRQNQAWEDVVKVFFAVMNRWAMDNMAPEANGWAKHHGVYSGQCTTQIRSCYIFF